MSSLVEDNVRHLPYYAIREIIEEITACIFDIQNASQEEIVKEILYLLNHSPRCRGLIDELLT